MPEDATNEPVAGVGEELTKAEILASISRLQLRLGLDLRAVSASAATVRQRDDIRDKTGELLLRLSEAAADVSDSDAPAVAWRSWAVDSIVSRLEALSALVSPILAVPLGVCTYPDGMGGTSRACTTEAECDLPRSHWAQGGCP